MIFLLEKDPIVRGTGHNIHSWLAVGRHCAGARENDGVMTAFIVPRAFDLSPGIPEKSREGFIRELITVLGMDRFTFLKLNVESRRHNRHALPT
jgi:hypothetical protein